MVSSGDDETDAAGLHERCVHRGHSATMGQADQERHGAGSIPTRLMPPPVTCGSLTAASAPGLNHKLRGAPKTAHLRLRRLPT